MGKITTVSEGGAVMHPQARRRPQRISEFHEKLKSLGFKSYQEYLASEHWISLRKRYWQSKLPKRCHGCGLTQGLQLHHRKYARLGEERLNDLILVCSDCHREIHAYEKRTGQNMWGVTNIVLRAKRKALKNQREAAAQR
ncbi:MAG TPA: HNH endonuclease signature motif containing protein [Nitrospira sp.]|nr:HNH endonuclease signature motif containing protein [Nitrospira sp.]